MTPDREYITEVLQELVKVNSVNPPGNEKVIAERVAALLEEIGIPSTVDHISETRANAIGFLKGQNAGSVLVLNGHLDTVPVKEAWSHSPFDGDIVGNRMYGLGTADMKGGIASMMAAMKMIKESNEKLGGSVILSCVADEERNNLGTRHFLNHCESIDYAVIGEPTNLDIVTSHRGVMRFRITTFGTAGHASNPSPYANAIYKINPVIRQLIERADTYGVGGKDYSARPSLSVTMVRGGTAENIIPDRCEIIIDRRIVYYEKMNDVEGEISALLKEIEENDQEFRYDLETTTTLDAWKVRDDSVLLKHGNQAYQKCFHQKPELTDLGATCEAALFAAKGIDTFVFGPGDIKNAHSKDEYVEISQLVKATAYYYALIREVLAEPL